MGAELRQLVDTLQAARQLLENIEAPESSKKTRAAEERARLPGANQMQHWLAAPQVDPPEQPTIRLVRQLSCTGGTLICKCIAALPNVALLSEVHPLTHLDSHPSRRFGPTDLPFLAHRGQLPLEEELKIKLFTAGVELTQRHVSSMGQYLVIREHSHSDFLVGTEAHGKSSVCETLADHYSIMTVMTVRHPVDSFLSMQKLDWMHYEPATFDEYCHRCLLFLQSGSESPRLRYEDFVANPRQHMESLCGHLELPFHSSFMKTFDLFRLTGDSGRSSPVITARPRRPIDAAMRREIAGSRYYEELCAELDYDPSTD